MNSTPENTSAPSAPPRENPLLLNDITGAVVEGREVVELKSMEKLAPVHSKQVLTSLRLMIVEPVNALSRQRFIWLGCEFRSLHEADSESGSTGRSRKSCGK